MSKTAVIQINDDVIKLSELAYVTKRTAQKSNTDTTPIYVVSMVLISGSPINIPFEVKNEADLFHSRLASEMGAVKFKLPTLAKK